jgi:hypothetical protein
MRRLIELVGGMRYDLCVLTGDYRGKTFGPFAATLEGVARVRAHLKEPVYGVLGDHDTIQMVPERRDKNPTNSNGGRNYKYRLNRICKRGPRRGLTFNLEATQNSLAEKLGGSSFVADVAEGWFRKIAKSQRPASAR